MKDRIIIADLGSTTTKVLLLKREDGFKICSRQEAPTTVEKPYEDVRIGLDNALALIQRETKEKFSLKNQKTLFLATSSAGGGLSILALGLMNRITAKAAQRAALGAGAVVLDVMALDDGRTIHERLEAMKIIRPDMILFCGGYDGGPISPLAEIAQMLSLANPKPKFRVQERLPVIYAGNRDALPFIAKSLEERFHLSVVPNILPAPGKENFSPAQKAIGEIFLNHVMQSAPGYGGLLEIVDTPILPTPLGFLKALDLFAEDNFLAFDMGGATTDVFTKFNGKWERSVAANLGMTYSLANLLRRVGIEGVHKWIPGEDREKIGEFILNRFVRPTTISTSPQDRIIEEAIAKEVLANAYIDHIEYADIKNFSPNLVLVSGGYFAHHPEKKVIKEIVSDAIGRPCEFNLLLDRLFILPHIGILSTTDRDVAKSLIPQAVVDLGGIVRADGPYKKGKVAMEVKIEGKRIGILSGERRYLSLPHNKKYRLKIHTHNGYRLSGNRKKIEVEVSSGKEEILLYAAVE